MDTHTLYTWKANSSHILLDNNGMCVCAFLFDYTHYHASPCMIIGLLLISMGRDQVLALHAIILSNVKVRYVYSNTYHTYQWNRHTSTHLKKDQSFAKLYISSFVSDLHLFTTSTVTYSVTDTGLILLNFNSLEYLAKRRAYTPQSCAKNIISTYKILYLTHSYAGVDKLLPQKEFLLPLLIKKCLLRCKQTNRQLLLTN